MLFLFGISKLSMCRKCNKGIPAARQTRWLRFNGFQYLGLGTYHRNSWQLLWLTCTHRPSFQMRFISSLTWPPTTVAGLWAGLAMPCLTWSAKVSGDWNTQVAITPLWKSPGWTMMAISFGTIGVLWPPRHGGLQPELFCCWYIRALHHWIMKLDDATHHEGPAMIPQWAGVGAGCPSLNTFCKDFDQQVPAPRHHEIMCVDMFFTFV